MRTKIKFECTLSPIPLSNEVSSNLFEFDEVSHLEDLQRATWTLLLICWIFQQLLFWTKIPLINQESIVQACAKAGTFPTITCVRILCHVCRWESSHPLIINIGSAKALSVSGIIVSIQEKCHVSYGNFLTSHI